jgi:hypothetical protein
MVEDLRFTLAGAGQSAETRLRIGYSFWGFLSGGVLDTPDGGRSYRRPVIDALQQAGNHVVFVQANRDLSEAGVDLAGSYTFEDGFPDLDAIIYEWRWPLPGRNTTVCGSAGHTCDLHRQQQLLDHYTRFRRLPTIIWDQDRQLQADDPVRTLANVRVAEYGLRPGPGGITVNCPVPDDLLDNADPQHLAGLPRPLPLVYVGNQYDRDDAFDRYFAPAAARVTHRVAGKWTNTGAWPHVNFTGRIGFAEVVGLHAQALATVLLMPERYRTVGAFGSRLFEAITQGCLPLTPAESVGADAFTPAALHVQDAADVIDKITWIERIAGTAEHAALIRSCLDMLDPYRTSRQATVLLAALRDLADAGPPLTTRSC